MNFFKWAIENKIIHYIEQNYAEIEVDMNENNSLSKSRKNGKSITKGSSRKKREELSVNAIKTFRQENVEIIVSFN